MANWLDDPAVKALLPHGKLIEEAFGLTEAERGAKAPDAGDRKDFVARRPSPRTLTRKNLSKTTPSRTVKPAA